MLSKFITCQDHSTNVTTGTNRTKKFVHQRQVGVGMHARRRSVREKDISSAKGMTGWLQVVDVVGAVNLTQVNSWNALQVFH